MAAERAKKLLEGQVAGLNEQLEEATKTKAKLEKVKRDLEAEIEEMKDQLEEEEEQKNELADTKAKMEAELEEAKKTLEKDVEAKELLEDQKRILERENQDLKDRLTEKEALLGDTERSAKKYKVSVRSIIGEISREISCNAVCNASRRMWTT